MNRIKSVSRDLFGKSSGSAVPKRSRDEYEFQPGFLEIVERPPVPWSRRTAAALIFVFLAALLWAILGHLDIQADAVGRLLVPSNSKVVQAIEAGEISAIHVRDGVRVKAGDLLISLNSVGANAELSELRSQLNFKLLERARLQALLTDDPVGGFVPPEGVPSEEVARAKEHLLSVTRERMANLVALQDEMGINRAGQHARGTDIAALRKLAKNIQDRLGAYRALAERKLLSNVELQQQERERLEIERSIAQQQAELGVLKAQHESMVGQRNSYLAKTAKEYHDSLSAVEIEISGLSQQLVRANEKLRLRSLRATVEGVVQQLAVHTLGGAIQPGEQLMVIVPSERGLQAEVMVLNGDVGFVRPGQAVELKIDSYPYTRYGTIPGKIIHVSRDSVKDERLGLVFPARVELQRFHMSSEDKSLSLQAGMSVVAEIRTGERRVIDYLLSPLREYGSEALRER
ncbi:HlyD family type I secretion periplasmic adaptor subunit [Lysobacter antibioticus]|uniref:HlyD family type I secretion periplasmic adaptor subunit n=1 Tax=Lysobacter antibioticus TaxID=84531 RepID=UPI000B24A816|nr:HlyD family type I secretion periplasmic adaptor subunit [Lysobacter antibioticus]